MPAFVLFFKLKKIKKEQKSIFKRFQKHNLLYSYFLRDSDFYLFLGGVSFQNQLKDKTLTFLQNKEAIQIIEQINGNKRRFRTIRGLINHISQLILTSENVEFLASNHKEDFWSGDDLQRVIKRNSEIEVEKYLFPNYDSNHEQSEIHALIEDLKMSKEKVDIAKKEVDIAKEEVEILKNDLKDKIVSVNFILENVKRKNQIYPDLKKELELLNKSVRRLEKIFKTNNQLENQKAIQDLRESLEKKLALLTENQGKILDSQKPIIIMYPDTLDIKSLIDAKFSFLSEFDLEDSDDLEDPNNPTGKK